MTSLRRTFSVGLPRIAAALALAMAAFSPRNLPAVEPVPQELKDIEIVEHLGANVPMDATFTDENGHTVTLGQYFKPGRPVILSLVYYTCPMLCNQTLNGMTQGFKALGMVPGKDYEIVTISINPMETAELAAAKKKTYMEELGKPEGPDAWHWLTGDRKNIDAVAQKIGFKYKYDPAEQQYLHMPAIYAVSPSGMLTRYLYGIGFPASDLKMALIEASEGKLGTTLDRLILYCHRYDSAQHRYTLAAMNVMRMGGGLTMVALFGTIGLLVARERARRARAAIDIPGGVRPIATQPNPLSH